MKLVSFKIEVIPTIYKARLSDIQNYKNNLNLGTSKSQIDMSETLEVIEVYYLEFLNLVLFFINGSNEIEDVGAAVRKVKFLL